MDPSDSAPIPPNGLVTLKIEINAPSGLLAQEFINSWGLMYLSVSYNGEPHEVKITEEMTRKLYEAFRPCPLNPQTTSVTTINGAKMERLVKAQRITVTTRSRKYTCRNQVRRKTVIWCTTNREVISSRQMEP